MIPIVVNGIWKILKTLLTKVERSLQKRDIHCFPLRTLWTCWRRICLWRRQRKGTSAAGDFPKKIFSKFAFFSPGVGFQQRSCLHWRRSQLAGWQVLLRERTRRFNFFGALLQTAASTTCRRPTAWRHRGRVITIWEMASPTHCRVTWTTTTGKNAIFRNAKKLKKTVWFHAGRCQWVRKNRALVKTTAAVCCACATTFRRPTIKCLAIATDSESLLIPNRMEKVSTWVVQTEKYFF